MKVAVFIDYDNLLETQRIAGILDVTTKVLLQMQLPALVPTGTCDVRVYGGWYEGSTMTPLAQKVTASVQSEFPKIVRVPQSSGSASNFTATAALAVSLLEEPGHHLFSTYRRKAAPTNIRVEPSAVVGCSDKDCILDSARKLLRTGSCPVPSCAVTSQSLVYRHEQKIVDTMLACDLIYSVALGYDRCVLVSGDDDFLPPLRTALLRGMEAIRFHPKPNCRRAKFPSIGKQLVEIDL
jgi:uncharacterized LabA/DUF88 family protein